MEQSDLRLAHHNENNWIKSESELTMSRDQSIFDILTRYNVGSVLRRLFSTAEAIQYCRGIASVLQRMFSTVGDSISTVGGIPSVVWGIPSVLWGIASVLWRDSISTAEG